MFQRQRVGPDRVQVGRQQGKGTFRDDIVQQLAGSDGVVGKQFIKGADPQDQRFLGTGPGIIHNL